LKPKSVKKFIWPLQRLLDVTVQKELAVRAKLFALSRRIADVHREIFRRRASLRSVLAELAELERRAKELVSEVQAIARERGGFYS